MHNHVIFIKQRSYALGHVFQNFFLSLENALCIMGLVVSHFMKPRNLKILVLGLDAAGKTTLLYRIKDGKALKSSIPTIGFNVEEIQVGLNLI